MGLFGALFAGVSGLDSQSNKIGVISNNIANVNTVGFKQGSASFSTLVVPSGTTSFSPGGVIGGNSNLVNQQGLIQATTSSTDVAISGNGLIVVNTAADDSGNTLLTRSGSFTQDSVGNFINTDGYFLQGFKLDANGNPPTNQSFSNLQTVSVSDSATGPATATSLVTLAANFNSAQKVLLGSGETTNLTTDTLNNTAENTGSSILIPDSINNLTRGDGFSVTSTNAATTSTYTYGGFVEGRSVNNGSVGDGNNVIDKQTVSTGITTYTAPGTTTSQSITGIDLPDKTTTAASGSGVFVAGQAITFDGASYTIGNTDTLTQIAAGLQAAIRAQNTMDTTSTVTVSGNPSNYTLTVTDTQDSAGTGFDTSSLGLNQNSSSTAATFAIGSALKSPAADQISLTLPTSTNNYAVGGYLNISGASAANGLTADDINGEQRITAINGNVITVAIGDGNVATGTAASNVGNAITVTNQTYPFTGNMLEATSASGDFLSGLNVAGDFTTKALQFSISTTSDGTFNFDYNASPNTSDGQFNTLSSLVTAINSSSNGTLTASIDSSGRLYISATDANQGLTFSNGDAVGTPGTSTTAGLSGINWVQEFDLPAAGIPAAASGVNYFNSLSGLSAQIAKVDPNLTASVNNPTSVGATLSINEGNPQSSITFTDVPGANNTGGSMLAALGFKGPSNSLLAGTGANRTTTLPLTYSPGSSQTDMSSGAVSPQFSKDITIYDSLGNSHNVALNVAKIGTNEWAVELTAVPASDVVSANGDGQIASGIVSFNGDGSLLSVTGGNLALAAVDSDTATPTQSVSVAWTNGANSSNLAFNLGTDGESNGLIQTASAFNVSVANQNGSAVGELTGVSIDTSGFVIASYSNGQTQKLYQVPLASVNNPDGLKAVTGDAYTQTLDSGIANLNLAGTNGVGTFSPSTVEESNVDLSTQLTDLIVAQQAYGANSKVLTIADQLLQELDQIIQ